MELPLPKNWHSAYYLARKVLPDIFCYQLGAVFGLAFPEVQITPHMSKPDARMLRDICQILATFDSRVAED